MVRTWRLWCARTHTRETVGPARDQKELAGALLAKLRPKSAANLAELSWLSQQVLEWGMSALVTRARKNAHLERRLG
jgi:hypothetical protein